MAKRDQEVIIFALLAAYQNNINTKITEINSEKADSITLNSIDSNAIVLLGRKFDESLLNYDPVLIMKDVDSEPISVQGATSYISTVQIDIVIHGDANGNEQDELRILYRYRRALSEVAEENARKVGFTDLAINEIPPEFFDLGNQGGLVGVSSVLLNFTNVG